MALDALLGAFGRNRNVDSCLQITNFVLCSLQIRDSCWSDYFSIYLIISEGIFIMSLRSSPTLVPSFSDVLVGFDSSNQTVAKAATTSEIANGSLSAEISNNLSLLGLLAIPVVALLIFTVYCIFCRTRKVVEEEDPTAELGDNKTIVLWYE